MERFVFGHKITLDYIAKGPDCDRHWVGSLCWHGKSTDANNDGGE